jgi:sialate O-acetylesterase
MKWIVWLAVVYFFALAEAQAEIRLPAIISDHAMFQADKPVAIWGWAAPGAKVQVSFAGDQPLSTSNFTATADGAGKWSGQLPACKAGTAGKLAITTDHGEQKTVNDILVGEVWLAGGQSNMCYVVGGTYGVDLTNPDEVAQIKQNIVVAQKEASELRPPIRYFNVHLPGKDEPADDVKGSWVLTDPKNLLTFSAVAWNFGVALENKLHVPVGLVVSCIGGTPVESWMSKEMLDATSVGPSIEERASKRVAGVTPARLAKYQEDEKAWLAANPTPLLQSQNKSRRPDKPYTLTDLQPVRLYNGMIHGLEPYTLRGVIWFQADGNMGRPFEYAELFQALIKGWRADWHDQLPFYFVEMNNMRDVPQTKPVQPNTLSIIREQQHAGLLLPGVDMAVTIDLGIKNPHFPNKKPVGERLAGLAFRDVYHQNVGQVDSPMFKTFTVEGNKIRLHFTNADGLRVRGGGDLLGFAIRGSTGDWVWATGQVEGQDIVVWNDQVPNPAAVRYAWAMNPVISVENGAGLPLSPFRTDPDSKE